MSQVIANPNDFADRLLSGEKLIWSGRPMRGFMLTSRDWFFIPFSLFWGGFSIIWVAIASMASKAPKAPAAMPMFPIFGIPFVLIGFYLIFGRFIVDAWVRQNTQYAVTTRRILISRPAPFGKFTALALTQLPSVNLSESRDGRGTIRFGDASSMFNNRNSWSAWTPALDPTPQFLGIEDARNIFEQIQRLQNNV